MRKRHTAATRQAAVVLVKHGGASVDTAAQALGVDARTIAKWLATEPVPDDAWEALQKYLLTLAADRTGRGDMRNLGQILTGAGIAARNVRYATLIARREARRVEQAETKAPNPVRAAIDAPPTSGDVGCGTS